MDNRTLFFGNQRRRVQIIINLEINWFQLDTLSTGTYLNKVEAC